MEENTVYHLAQTLQNTQELQEAFSNLQHTLYDMVEKNYLSKIQTAARAERDMTIEHPSKEVTLLRALAPFTDERGQERIQEICHNLLFLQTMGNIQQNVKHLTEEGALLAVRSAGNEHNPPSPISAQLAGILMTWTLLSDFQS